MEPKRLTRRDVAKFDNDAANIVLELTNLGWLGSVSNRGHAIMRAPDGQSTVSVSRSSNSRRLRAMRVDVKRWKREHP